MKKPVILLAFANDKVDNTRYLRNLPLEADGLRKAMQPAVRAGLCEVVERVNVTVEQILDLFQSAEYRDRIAGVHYGGHADGYQLLLESPDGSHSVAHGGGLVSFLAKQTGLKFVFFNGCSTEQQTLELTEAGVPAVIGTSSSVNDDIATALAVRFYKSLGQGAKLQRAWNEAVDEIKLRHGAETTGLYRRKRGETPPETFPWNLYIRAGGEAVRDWNLADAADNPLYGLPDLPAENLPESPYRFLERYKKEHAEILFGRSYYIRDLYKRIEDTKAAPVILLYGQSGVGKSSLLDAGLLPRLEQNFRVVYIRRDAALGLEGTLKTALGIPADLTSEEEIQTPLLPEIQEIDEKINQTKNLFDGLPEEAKEALLQVIVQLENKKNSLLDKTASGQISEKKNPAEVWKKTEEITERPLIILLDQAEEVFTRPNKDLAEEFDAFLRLIADIFNKTDNRPAGKLILSYRKEYNPEIKEGFVNAGVPREEIFLKALDRKDIAEVVSGLTLTDRLRRTYRLNVEAELPIIIADDLLEDKESSIAPILQILLTKMWQLTENDEVRSFTVAKYQALRKQGILMDDFFYDQMAKFRQAFPHQDQSGLALDILFAHTTRLGTADSRNLDDIRAMYNLRQEKINDIISEFKNLYLLTDAGAIMTGLAHDTLAPVVQHEFRSSDRPGQRAAIILQNKITAYEHNPENLIDEDDLRIVEEGAGGMRILTLKEQELVEASREKRARNQRNRRMVRAAGAALVSIILLMTATGFFYQQKVAKEQELLMNQAIAGEEKAALNAKKAQESAAAADSSARAALKSEKSARLEKDKADKAKNRAVKSEKIARMRQVAAYAAQNDAEKQRRAAMVSEANAQLSEEIARTNLNKANKLVGAFYFYEDRFGLAYGEIERKNKFYFIDKNGDRLQKFGTWDKAEQFDGMGLAKVQSGQKSFLLDTLGNKYPAAYSLADLNRETKALDLRGKKYTSFPDSVCDFTGLEIIIADKSEENRAFMPMPARLNKLRKLKVLSWDNCDLTELPDGFGKLRKLEALYMNNNLLDSLPEDFADLRLLKTLVINQNNFSNLPIEITKINHLKRFRIGDNQLEDLPEIIYRMTELSYLDLSGNKFDQIPAVIGKLGNLEYLNFHKNQLKVLPAEIGLLKKLKHLDLWENDLDSLPAEIRELKSLSYLDLEDNKLTFLPEEIGELQNLETLYLSDNNLYDLPASFANLESLHTFYLGENNIAELPAVLFPLENLIFLSLTDNDLENVPEEIGDFKKLKTLFLDDNLLENLPPEIGQLENLTELHLDNNKLTDLPSEIGELKKLKLLSLQFNNLAKLPAGIGGLESLSKLHLQFNLLTELPAQFNQLSSLELLNLDNNRLSDLTGVIFGLSSLEDLNLSRNLLSELPEGIGYLLALKKLNLSQNSLTQFPKEMEMLSKLTTLIAAQNNLESFPTEIGKLKKLTDLNLSDNQISELPAGIGRSRSLISLDLSKNGLTELPERIKELRNLTQFNLSENQFTEDEQEKTRTVLPNCRLTFEAK